MNTTIRSLATATALCAAALVAAPDATADDYPRMNLRVAHAFPASWVQTRVDQWWADEIKARSGNKIRITMMWAGAGGAPLEIINLVGKGAVDMGAVPPAYFPNELPLTGAPNTLPLTFTRNEEAIRVINGLVAEVPAVREELKENNIWPLFFHTLNTYQPLCTKPIGAIGDFEGLRIRSYGPYQPKLWDSLGAVGVVVLPAEIYEGLQKGRLDCGFYSTDLYKATKLYEVAKYLTTAGFGPQPTWPIWVNYEKWHNEYPENVKKLIMEVSAEASERSLKDLAAAHQESLDDMVAAGVEVVEFTDEDQLMTQAPDFKALWLEDMKKKGIGDGAQAVVDYWTTHADPAN